MHRLSKEVLGRNGMFSAEFWQLNAKSFSSATKKKRKNLTEHSYE